MFSLSIKYGKNFNRVKIFFLASRKKNLFKITKLLLLDKGKEIYSERITEDKSD